MKKVSVIVPVYNTARYLKKCLESIINQTYNNLEIILINDGSTDNSLQICESYKKKDRRIKLINKHNTGQSDSRFYGFSNSTGDYTYCVDSDDTIEDNAVELLVSGLERTNSDMFFARARLVNENGKFLNSTRKYSVSTLNNRAEIVSDALGADNIKASLCMKICRRELWEKCYSDEVRRIRFNEDYFLTILFSLESKSVGFTNEIIYNVLQRTGSVSRNVRDDMLLSHDFYFPIISKTIESILPKLNYLQCYYKGYAKNVYISLLIAAIRATSYRTYLNLYRLLDTDSIFRSDIFISYIRKESFGYRILDIVIRIPRLFYFTAKVLSNILQR